MRKLSLFSGIGGIDLAAQWAGMETVAFCEREAFPQKVLRKHWPDVPIYDDVCTLTAERLKEDGIIGPGRTIDIISAGYPCQPESTAGKRRGKEDDRWLWPEVRRIIKEIRPGWFIGENVFGHVSLGLDTVLSDLEDDDYTVEAIVIPAAAVGAPHRRDRVIVVANSSGGERRSRSQIEGILRALSENGAEYSDVDGSSATQSRGDVAHSDCNGRGWEKRTRSRSVAESIRTDIEREGHQKRNSDQCSSQTVAHSESEFERGLSFRERTADTGPSCCCEDVADSKGERFGEAREHCERSEKWTSSSNTSGNSNSIKLQGKQSIRDEALAGRNKARQHQGAGNGTKQQWTIESGLGGVLDGLSDWLDGHRWPAGLGQEQYDWEPPRVATGVKDRAPRLKALGNAVNPYQVYPILAAIKHINDLIERGHRA